MARTNNLANFLTDVAAAIKEKTGSSETINGADFDTEISSIHVGVDTSDGNIVSRDLKLGKIAYSKDEKVQGSYDTTKDVGMRPLKSITINNDQTALVNYYLQGVQSGDISGLDGFRYDFTSDLLNENKMPIWTTLFVVNAANPALLYSYSNNYVSGNVKRYYLFNPTFTQLFIALDQQMGAGIVSRFTTQFNMTQQELLALSGWYYDNGPASTTLTSTTGMPVMNNVVLDNLYRGSLLESFASGTAKTSYLKIYFNIDEVMLNMTKVEFTDAESDTVNSIIGDLKFFNFIPSNSNAEASNLEVGTTAYNGGGQIVGTLAAPNSVTWENSTVTDDSTNSKLKYNITETHSKIIKPATTLVAEATYSTVANAIGLTADKIKNNETILGVTGTLNPGTDTSDATAVASNLEKGKTAYNANGKITGTVKAYGSDTTGYVTRTLNNGAALEEQVISNNNLDSSCSYVVLSEGAVVNLSDLPVDVHNKNIILWHVISKSYSSENKYYHQYLLGIAPDPTDVFILDRVNYVLFCANAAKTVAKNASYYSIVKQNVSSDYIPLDNTFTVTGPTTNGRVNRYSVAAEEWYTTNISYGGTSISDSSFVNDKGSSIEYSYCQHSHTHQYAASIMLKGASDIYTPLSNSKLATAIGLAANKIKKDEVILNITGTYEGSGGSSDYAKFVQQDRSENNLICYIYTPILQDGDLDTIEDIFENDNYLIQTLLSIAESDSSEIKSTLESADVDVLNDILTLCDMVNILYLFREDEYYDVIPLNIVTTSATTADIANVSADYGLYSTSFSLETDTETGETEVYTEDPIVFIDTSDANATASDIVQGKTAYVNGELLTGTNTGMPSNDYALTDFTGFTNLNFTYGITEVGDLIYPAIVNCNGAFDGWGHLQKVGKLSFSSSVSSLSTFFRWCAKLTSVDLSVLNTANVTDMTEMFRGCSSLVTLDLSTLDTRKVKYFNMMFNGCTSLTDLTFGENFSMGAITALTSVQAMFASCTSLSNTMLNKILGLLLTISDSATGTRTLKYIGLTSAQATTCTGLSNWAALETAGWTTGY